MTNKSAPPSPTEHQDRGDDHTHPVERGILILENQHSAIKETVEEVVPDGFQLRVHTDLNDLISAGLPNFPSCLLLAPGSHSGKTGLEVLEQLQSVNWKLPTVLVAGQWDLPMVVTSMKAGADGFIAEPIDPAELLETLNHALDRARNEQLNDCSASHARKRVNTLNSRESEIVRLIVKGLLNKEIADQLSLALVTVKLYRSRAMKKLEAGNPAEMVNIALMGGLNFDDDKDKARLS